MVLIGALLLLFSAGTAYFIFAVPETAVKRETTEAEVTVRDLAVEVRSLGTLEAKTAHMISSQIRGPGAKIIFLAPNGRFVSKGETLVQFDAQPYEDAVADLSSQVDHLTAAVTAARQLVEWEKNEAAQRIITAEYQQKVAKLELKRLIEGDGPLTSAQYKDELDKAELELKHYQDYESDLRGLEKEGISSSAEIERIAEQVKLLREKQQSAKRQYDSYQKYVLPAMIESARAREQNAALTIEQTRQASVHKIASAEATVHQAEGQLKAVELNLEKARGELEKTTIRAPFDGLIVHYETFRDGELRTPREGDTVIVNQPILYFPDISTLMVRSQVREIDLNRIMVGQQATVRIDAYPEERYPAELSFIGALAKKRAGATGEEKFFQVMFQLKGGDDRLRPGMSAKVTVHTAFLQGVTTLPIQAVFQDSGGDYCYLHTGSFYEKRYFTPGLQNEDFVEVKKGLAVGARVSLVEPDPVR